MNDEPLYNIGVVSRMTGISVATLRVWERRYGFPNASRTPGGHRLYTEREIARLRWVKAQTDKGLHIGQAIRNLEHLEKSGHFPESLPQHDRESGQKAEGFSREALRDNLTTALLSHDLETADRLLGEALPIYPLEALILDVIGPTWAEIGEAWMSGRISVATEHLATSYLRHRLLMWLASGPPARRLRPVVLACAPGEWHEGSLLMFGVLLRRQGWPIAYLGQSLPLPDLARFVKEIRPLAVVLVAMTEEPARALTEWPRWLPEAHSNNRPLIGFAGRIFTLAPEWRAKVPGIFLGPSLAEGLKNLDALLREITGVLV